MNTTKNYSDLDEMVSGMLAISTRADGKQTLTKDQAILLVQAHISASTPCQDMQNSTNHLQENCCGSCQRHPTSSLSAQPMNQDQAVRLQLTHQQVQAKPTP